MKIEGGNAASSEGVTITLDHFDELTVILPDGVKYEFSGGDGQRVRPLVETHQE